MAKIEFLGPIGVEPMEVDITNINELPLILNGIPQLKEWLHNSAVAVNDSIISSLDVDIEHNDVITILPPVCGG